MIRKKNEIATGTDASKQTGYLVKSFTKSEKKTMSDISRMSEVVTITLGEMVALKAKLGIPWGKLNTIGR